MIDFILTMFGFKYSVGRQVSSVIARRVAKAQSHFDAEAKKMAEENFKVLEQMRLDHIAKKDRLLEEMVDSVLH